MLRLPIFYLSTSVIILSSWVPSGLAQSFNYTSRDPLQSDPETTRRLNTLTPAIRKSLSGDNIEAQRAALNLLSELAGNIAVSTAGIAVEKELAEFIIKTGNSEMRALGLKAFGKISFDTPLAIKVLEAVAKDTNPQVQKATAEASVNLLRKSSTTSFRGLFRAYYWTASPAMNLAWMQQYSQYSEFNKLVKLVLPIASGAIENSDPEVRLAGLNTFRTASRILFDAFFPDPSQPRDDPKSIDPNDRKVRWVTLLPAMETLNAEVVHIRPALQASQTEVRLNAVRTVEVAAATRKLALASRTFEPEPILNDSIPHGLPADDPLISGLKQLLPDLSNMIRDPEAEIRQAAIEAIEPFNGNAEALKPAIIQASKDPSIFVRWTVARTLGRMAPAKPKNVAGIEVEALAQLCNDDDLDVRSVALTALQKYGRAGKAVVDSVLRATNMGDAEGRVVAVKTLTAIEADAGTALPSLITALDNKDLRLQRAAVLAIGKYGPDARPALDRLRGFLTSTDTELRTSAAEAILLIETGTKPSPGL